MNGNWIKINRQMLESHVFQDAKTLQVFMFLLLNANYKKRTLLNGLTLDAGQLCTSRARISAACNMHPSSVSRVLKRLQRCSSIVQKPNSTGTVIGITNWGLFQHAETVPEQQPNSKRTATDTRPNTEEEGKTETMKEDINSSQANSLQTLNGSKGGSIYSAEFNRFWELWPPRRKTGKRGALAAFKKAKKRVDVSTLMAAVEEFAKSNKGRGEYCPKPTSWLNGDCWDDDRAGWQEGAPPPLAKRERTAEEVYATVRVRELTTKINELRADGQGMSDEAELLKQELNLYSKY